MYSTVNNKMGTRIHMQLMNLELIGIPLGHLTTSHFGDLLSDNMF